MLEHKNICKIVCPNPTDEWIDNCLHLIGTGKGEYSCSKLNEVVEVAAAQEKESISEARKEVYKYMTDSYLSGHRLKVLEDALQRGEMPD